MSAATPFNDAEKLERAESRGSRRTSGDATAVGVAVAEADPMRDEELKATGVALPPDWDTDPENPLNYTSGRKWSIAGVVALYTLVTPLASSMLAPGLAQMAIAFKERDPTLVAMILSIFVLGFALGPMVYGPLSEMYGRKWVLHFSTATFLVWNTVGIWAPNIASMLVFRLLGGLFGSAAVAIGGGVISDLFRPHERAGAMGLYSLGPLLGPIIGPVAGGFIAGGPGYKYIFVTVSALTSLSLIVGLPVLQETYAPVIIKQRTLRRMKEAEARGEPVDHFDLGEQTSLGQLLWINLTRPLTMLFRSFIIAMFSLYISLVYGILYLCLTSFPMVFQSTYHWGTSVIGLAYLGLGVGFLFMGVVGSGITNKVYLNLVTKNGGKATPEFRIPGMIAGSLLVPIGLFFYGWTARASVHWIAPIIGSAIFGGGMILTFIALQLYIVDAYEFAASALAATSLLRSLFGFAFPLFAKRLFDALGVGGGNSLLGGFAILLGIPFPVYLWYRGDRLRAADPLALK